MRRFLALCFGALLALVPLSAQAAWSVTHKTNNHSAGAHTVVVSAVTIPAGHIAWVAIAARPAAAGDVIGVTDSAGNTYTVRQCPVAGSTTNTSAIAIGYMTNALSAGSITVADGAAATFTDVFADVSDVSGGKTSSIEDTSVFNCAGPTNNTNPLITSGSPSQAGDLILGMTEYSTGTNTYTEDGTWTAVLNTGDSNVLFADAYIVNAGSGTVTRNATLLNSKAWTVAVVGLAPPGGGAAAVCTRSLLGVGC